jgi:hypothetical protein
MAVPSCVMRFHPREMLAAKPAHVPRSLPLGLDQIARLLAAYRASAADAPADRESMWTVFQTERQQELHRVFMQGSPAAALSILADPRGNDLFHGFDGLCRTILARRNAASERDEVRAVVDELFQLAAALGVGPRIFCPEIALQQVAPPDPDALLDAIDAALGQALTFPNPFAGEMGVATRRGIVSYRSPPAVYQAFRMRQLAAGTDAPVVAEIGGGLGRTAFHAHRLGLRNYTLVDLPMTAIAQGYFLIGALGPDAVSLHGEARGDGRLRIVPPSVFLADERRHDLVANIDSLTEMGRATAEAYLRHIRRCARVFWSVNHETNPYTVRELLGSAPDGVSDTRVPYWMRKGYVEETVLFGTGERAPKAWLA